MRIISGKYKSRKIFTPGTADSKNRALRPTSDRARETLFDTLHHRINFTGMKCLDLFAGTGSFGFECISRGAESCDFVDMSRITYELIHKTADGLGCSGQVIYIRRDALAFLIENPDTYYDIIFADPPYDFPKIQKLAEEVLKRKLGVFILESGKEISTPAAEKGFEILNKKVGYTHFKIFITT
jgi:16S rRNA (guanine966-N2)-methyltransferase